VHAVRVLSGGERRRNVAFIDGGTEPWAALAAAEGSRALVVLDAVAGGKEPGRFHRLRLDEVDTAGTGMSLHGLTLFHALHWERILGRGFDEVWVMGMEPDVVEPGLGLSNVCETSLPGFVEMVGSELSGIEARYTQGQGGA